MLLAGLKRFILWDYARATWQYDVMVGLILAFVFLTPRAWFRDQPRIPKASRIALLPAEHGSNVFWIEAQLLAGIPEAELLRKASELLRVQAGEKQSVMRLEPILDSDREIKGYMAFTGPVRTPPGN